MWQLRGGSVADPADMKAALVTVLADPVFVRSPALASLLAYLVEQTLAGHGKTLKSYSVAVDGLGKSPDFDSQVDTYARVLVMRLRKALDTYYATAGAHNAQRLAIESGAYEVLLEPNGHVRPAPEIGAAAPVSASSRRIIAAVLIAVLVLAGALIMQWRANLRADIQRWRTSNFPFVDVSVEAEGGGRKEAELARQMRQSIITNIGDYDGVMVAYNPSERAAYRIKVVIKKSENGYDGSVFVVDKSVNRLIFSENHEMTYDSSDDKLSSDRFLALSVFHIVHSTGIIHSSERRRVYPANTPYGCWLRFTYLLQNNPAVEDSTLSECAENWLSAAPDHPVAAALHGWALVNRANEQFTETGRREALPDAVAVLESARAMNPNSPLLQVSAMRAYAFIGDSNGMHAAAEAALRVNPQNLDVLGVAGMTLALQNDPQGEILVNKAIADHFNPPPWYFIGTFVAAMMRDDLAGTERALVGVKGFQHRLPISGILTAAHQARLGHIDRARAAWAEAVALRPLLRIKPDAFFSRLPIAPLVRKRLEQWLAPVLRKDQASAALPPGKSDQNEGRGQ